MLELIYDENFITGIKKDNIFNWYILNKEYFCNLIRNNLENNNNNLTQYYISTQELTLLLLKTIENNNTLEEFEPVIFIDYDSKTIYSQYPEPNSFDTYIPNDWKYNDMDCFIDLLNNQDKYWIYNKKNLFDL